MKVLTFDRDGFIQNCIENPFFHDVTLCGTKLEGDLDTHFIEEKEGQITCPVCTKIILYAKKLDVNILAANGA